MTDIDKYVKCFNSKLSEFANDLVAVFPADPDFKLFRTSNNLLKTVSEKQPVEVFKAYALGFKDKIYNMDEGFFMDEGFGDRNLHLPDKHDHINIVKKLTKYWENMTPDNKAVIWNYLILLTKLAERC
jgi:hypothetical protein